MSLQWKAYLRTSSCFLRYQEVQRSLTLVIIGKTNEIGMFLECLFSGYQSLSSFSKYFLPKFSMYFILIQPGVRNECAFLFLSRLLLIPPLFHVIYFGNSYDKSPLLYLCGVFARKKKSILHMLFLMPGNFKRTFGCVTIIDYIRFSIPSNLGRDGKGSRLKLELIWISLAVCGFSSLFTYLSVNSFWPFHHLLPYLSGKYLKESKKFWTQAFHW